MKKKPAKKTAPKKSASKKATKPSAKKTAQKVTKKTPAKKPTTKKTVAKQTATKTTQADKKPSTAKQSGLVTVNLKFHPDSNGGHHHIIVEDLGNNHVSVGVTTEPKYDKKHKNVELEHSPLSNGETSYARRKGTVDKKANYNSPKQGEITQTDSIKVKQIADKAKAKVAKGIKK